ncbi:class I adenylate-forming enzyme family protein [Micromonospora sp. NBC_01813]|uniref:class I adenylate-forming enzyme family protein n=1 Tax=Micromonospora sp. NBC_01813 TaxID=2975988 RepID=UPI002DD9C354|nr:fatty acid--CoA ligase family protein [Micromonospora sp. NBC_01813]WSA07682.1 fatty acid--CoA ligase family protein [Micromonospora sp. NBC_01813]
MAPDRHPQAILDLLAAAADRPVFEHGARLVTGAELLDAVGRISTGLRAAGIGPGDGLAMSLGVTPEAFAAMIAAQVVGARVAGVRSGLTPRQLRHVVTGGATGPANRAVVVDRSTATAGLRAAADGLDLLAVGPLDGVTDLLTGPASSTALDCTGRPDDIGRITYTSGSTGDPKGCMETYAGLGAAWAPYPDRWPSVVRDLAAQLDRFLVFGSLSSLVMMEYTTLTLAAGGTAVIAEPTGGPEPFLPHAIARLRATASVAAVPRLHQLVVGQLTDPVDLSTLRALMVSGSPLEPGRLAQAEAVLGPVVYHGYGQTETGLIAMMTPAETAAVPARLASVGRPPEVVRTQIRDSFGKPVPTGGEGELFVRTPSQATGYWGDPAETADVFVDGWVRTRDLARFDADGYLYLLGRVRDVIIVNADLRYAGPIERVLASHPAVAEAYVVGLPDEQTGEAVHAFVVPTTAERPDPTVLADLVAGRLGPASRPRTVTFIDEVPVGPSGKPDKRQLRPLDGSPVQSR